MKKLLSVKFHNAVKVADLTEHLWDENVPRCKNATMEMRDDGTVVIRFKSVIRCVPTANVHWYDEAPIALKTKKAANE